MSGLDFLVLVLQSSNKFDLNAFYRFFLDLFLPGYIVHLQYLQLRAVCLTGLFGLD